MYDRKRRFLVLNGNLGDRERRYLIKSDNLVLIVKDVFSY